MSEDLENYPDRIADMFAGKTILITGTTGFIGKVLLEKFLRCFDVKRVYILIREKWGASVNERAAKILRTALFDKARKLKGEHITDKCIPMPYDLTHLNLGLSEENRQTLIDEVDIVCHSAAEVRFENSLKKVILTNVRAVRYMLELAKEMKNLQAFLHISTTFCHPDQEVLEEKAYAPQTDPHQLIQTVESLSESEVEKRHSEFVGKLHNSYTFTKGLSEALCVEQFDSLPILIVRPSVVVPVWKEPIPGWCDSINGAMGITYAIGKGVLKGLYADPDVLIDMIPVDIVVNAIVCCIWGARRLKRNFFNICASPEYKISIQDMIDVSSGISEIMPFNNIAWLPFVHVYRSKILHRISLVFVNFLPGLIIDGVLICLRYKPVLSKINMKLYRGLVALEHFTYKTWDFRNDMTMKDRELLNPKERQLYKLDGDGLDYTQYQKNCSHSGRLYYFKEPDETLPAARRHYKIMKAVHYFTKYLFRLIALYLLYKYMLTPIYTKIF